MPQPTHLFANVPPSLQEELVQTLARGSNVRIERIVSLGHRSEDDFWYDQPEHEWVMVLRGAARLMFDGGRTVEMAAGDAIDIPAHARHRVEWTDPKTPTIWLAVHYC